MPNIRIRRCPICGAMAASTAFPFVTRFNEVSFNYFKCSGCSSVFVDPIPDEQTFDRMYTKSDYHDCYYIGREDIKYAQSARLLKQYLVKGDSVLDYCCGVGTFLNALDGEGFVPFGVEFDKDAADFSAREVGCSVLTVNEFSTYTGEMKFDAIHLGDVLEHLPDPSRTLKQLLNYSKPNGVLFVEGPLEINPSPVYWFACTGSRVQLA